LEIENLRKCCHSKRRALKRGLRGGDLNEGEILHDDYREARKQLKRAIQRSKKECWGKLCRQVESDTWGLPYRMVIKKVIGLRPIPGISLPGRLEHIVETLFPEDTERIWPATMDTPQFPEVTTEEISRQAGNIPAGKAPGPDGVPDLVIKGIDQGIFEARYSL